MRQSVSRASDNALGCQPASITLMFRHAPTGGDASSALFGELKSLAIGIAGEL